jgi:quinol monooxygenase YgiN
MIRIVRLSLKPEFIQNFTTLFDERKQLIKQAEGCTHLELWKDDEHEGVFYTYSLWEDSKFLERYRKSELFSDTWSIVKPWFAESPRAYSAHKKLDV